MPKLRSFIMLACITASLAGGSAGASATGSAYQQINLNAFGENQDLNLFVRNVYSAGATPSVTWEATASSARCDEAGCSGEYFNWQRIDPTALTMDPLGNSARVLTTLTSSTNQVRSFNLTFSRPTTLSVNGCFPLVACVNAWIAPDGSSAGASSVLGLNRSGYVVSGTFAGAPFDPSPFDWVDARSTTTTTTATMLP